MSYKPPKPAQTEPEMLEQLATEKQAKRKPYKVESDEHRADVLSALIGKRAAELEEIHKSGTIPLANTEAVKKQTLLYLKCCEKVGAFPSVAGLARSLGYSRQSLYNEIDRRSNPETADWLMLCRDTFLDILTESALTNNANSIVAIFLAKAEYGLRETMELIARPADAPLGEMVNAGKLVEKYLPSDEEDAE